MAGKGGATPGAGRKRKADKYFGPINRAEKQIAEWLPELILNMKRLADGVTLRETTKEGKEIVYTTAPDRGANEYLVNRLMGKPVDRKEISGQEGNDINLNVVVKQTAAIELEAWRQQVNARLEGKLTEVPAPDLSAIESDDPPSS